MTYDELCDLGTEQERAERLARAEAIITEAQGDSDAELTAQGELCLECGERFRDRQGVPSLCRDCGGTAPLFGRSVVDAAAAKRVQLGTRLAYHQAAILVSPYAAVTESEERRTALLRLADMQDAPARDELLRDIVDAVAPPTARVA